MKKRCPWAQVNESMRRYHDTEWGVPQLNDRILFEYLLLDSFQAGLSWAIILQKRENFRKAFAGFDPAQVARFTKRKRESLLQNAGIVRNRAKIEAMVQNATVFLAVQKEFGSFAAYLWGKVNNRVRKNRWKTLRTIPSYTKDSKKISADLKKRGFRFFGPTVCYAFMQGAGLVNDHIVFCFRHRQV